MTRAEKKEELIGLFSSGSILIGDMLDEAMDFAEKNIDKLISMTLYGEKEYTLYKVLCKKRWYLPWKGVTIGGNLCSYDLLHEWYNSKEEAIAALKKVLNEIEVQKNYPVIKEEEIE